MFREFKSCIREIKSGFGGEVAVNNLYASLPDYKTTSLPLIDYAYQEIPSAMVKVFKNNYQDKKEYLLLFKLPLFEEVLIESSMGSIFIDLVKEVVLSNGAMLSIYATIDTTPFIECKGRYKAGFPKITSYSFDNVVTSVRPAAIHSEDLIRLSKEYKNKSTIDSIRANTFWQDKGDIDISSDKDIKTNGWEPLLSYLLNYVRNEDPDKNDTKIVLSNIFMLLAYRRRDIDYNYLEKAMIADPNLIHLTGEDHPFTHYVPLTVFNNSSLWFNHYYFSKHLKNIAPQVIDIFFTKNKGTITTRASANSPLNFVKQHCLASTFAYYDVDVPKKIEVQNTMDEYHVALHGRNPNPINPINPINLDYGILTDMLEGKIFMGDAWLVFDNFTAFVNHYLKKYPQYTGVILGIILTHARNINLFASILKEHKAYITDSFMNGLHLDPKYTQQEIKTIITT